VDFERTKPEIRYHNDAVFHAMVDQLYYQIKEAHYTPTELREACHLAACMYEELHVRPMFINPKEPFVWNVVEKI
jgi:hypothetical protein